MNILNMVILIFLTQYSNNMYMSNSWDFCRSLSLLVEPEGSVVCSFMRENEGKETKKRKWEEIKRTYNSKFFAFFFFFHSIIEKMRENIIWYYYHIWEYEKRVEIVGASITKNTMFWPFTLFIFFLIFNFLNLLYYHL